MNSIDSFNCKANLEVNGKNYVYFSLIEAEKNGLAGISRLPFSLKILLENLLRHEDGNSITKQVIENFVDWLENRGKVEKEIAFRPARVLMQDFTGVPAIVDLAAMRDAMVKLGGEPQKINPQIPVDLVIDHSVMVDFFAKSGAFAANVEAEYQRNVERYTFLKWGQQAFQNFRVVPPGTGICHQVNLEYLGKTVWTKTINGEVHAYPDTLVGTDSHTTMINGLSVLGWGVGGIEAEAAMLGQPISMLIPETIGFELKGELTEGITATDLVLAIVEKLRKFGVVGKFVEFYGEGLDNLSLEDQATIANMAPEYGATVGFFPIDKDTLAYLKATGRSDEEIALVNEYAKAQGLMRGSEPLGGEPPLFTENLLLDLSQIEASIAGPKRPQDRVALSNAKVEFNKSLVENFNVEKSKNHEVSGKHFTLTNGDIVIAAITSCTNTSNPFVLLAAGLLAKRACELGLTTKEWVKTSLAPGSQVVSDYLEKAGLQQYLDELGFNLVGYGCTTCIGNSGPLAKELSQTIGENNLVVCSVLSGNRNFEGRISPDVKANYLASPPLVVAYAIAGNLNFDLTRQALGQDKNGKDIFLKDIWPSTKEVSELMQKVLGKDLFQTRYASVFKGDEKWQEIESGGGDVFNWSESSTYVRNPPYFANITKSPEKITEIKNARILSLFGDSITTDHISPAGSIKGESPAGNYLTQYQVRPVEFNSYGARRGNHEIMMRGTFANIRIKNQMLKNVEGGFSKHYPSQEMASMYEVAMKYKAENVPLVVLAGREYGTGSSRDWAAKGTKLLGVRAVIAQSFERIHRSNLVGMGVLPLVFGGNDSWQSLGFKGDEQITIQGVGELKARQKLKVDILFASGENKVIEVQARIDTNDELEYFNHGGILPFVLRELNK